MHALAVVMIPFDSGQANIRPRTARDAAIDARIDTLLFRYEQPEDDAWGVDLADGFKFDWCEVGGRWGSWGRHVRKLARTQRRRPSSKSVPRLIEPYAVWTEDLAQVRFTPVDLLPVALITPHGEWEQCQGDWVWAWGKPSARERKFKAAWLRRLRRFARAYPSCLAIAVDFHF